MLTIYHNPRFRKIRETLTLIEESGTDVQIVEYLKEVPSAEELKTLLNKLGISAEQLLRKNEALFKENYKCKTLSEDEWVRAIIENPKLIERPIVVKGDQAVLGRPREYEGTFRLKIESVLTHLPGQ